MYSKFKRYMIGEALSNAKTVFDMAKLELLFNVILIYIIIYIIGTIPILIGKYWLIIGVQIIGFSFIVAMAVAVKKTKSIDLSRKIWFVSGIFFTISTAVLNSGQASFLTYAFSMVNIVISFLLLERFLRNIAVLYYILFLCIAVSVSFGIIPKLTLPIDMTKEHIFFDQPNINAVLIALIMITFIIDRFIKSHQTATHQVLYQKEQVIRQKELLDKKNDTIITSIELATKLQSDTKIDWLTIKEHFSEHFHIDLPKEDLSGEFFWVKRYKDSVYFAIVDTGEAGVAGAMFSFMIRSGLDKAIKKIEQQTPENTLQFINSFVTQSLSSIDSIEPNLKISLCQYSCYDNVLNINCVDQPIIVRKSGQLKSYFPKNKNLDKTEKVEEMKIKLAKGDIIYLFSDGVSGKGITSQSQVMDYSNFKSILYAHNDKEISQKKIVLSQVYESLKVENKQVDDVTIVGLKV